jgi:hypothetical protein
MICKNPTVTATRLESFPAFHHKSLFSVPANLTEARKVVP